MKKAIVALLIFIMMLPLNLNASESSNYDVSVDKSGEYYLEIEYISDEDVSTNDVVEVYINGEDVGNYRLNKSYKYTDDEFELDRYGKEITSVQEVIMEPQSQILANSEYATNYNVFDLNEGHNNITIVPIDSDVEILSVSAKATTSNYKAGSETNSGISIMQEAEQFSYKNDIQINAKSKASAETTPLSPGNAHINVIDGETFNENGMSITYKVDITEPGLYDIYFAGDSEGVKNLYNYINIYVNGELALEDQPILIENNYDISKIELPIYLESGTNEITFELSLNNYEDILIELDNLREEITELSTELVQLTGGIEDESRDWGLTNFMPDVESQLNEYKETLNNIREQIVEIGSEDVDLVNSIDLMISNIDELILDIDNIPNHMSLLSEGSTSLLTLTNQMITRLTTMGLEFDKFYLVSSGEELNVEKISIFDKMAFGIKNFITSFNFEEVDGEQYDQEIEVWVNKPRQYVDVMQKLTDQNFTPETGIKVNFSVLTDQNKLTMANAAHETPDAAISLDSWYAYELGLRGALVDLNTLEGTEEMIENVTPGGLLPVIVDDSLYGISETQDLYVMYYRTDIFETFGYEVPDTWDDVLKLLPDLMGNGMNFYIPLSGTAALKSFPATSMFFMQNEVPIYKENGFGTNLDTPEGLESLRNMTNMYELYGLELNTANFFDSFKSGDIPIGISNFATYIQLQNAADEIEGNWAIAPIPGMVNDEGEVVRWHSGSTTVDTIFMNSEKQDLAAEFLNWWTSTEVQTEFNDMLISIYGVEYIWNSANVDAFLNLPLPEKDLAVFETSLEWVQEVPKVPGGYIVERSISDIWNGVVFDGEDVKRLTEEKVQDINIELEKKMIEFGYISEDGEIIKDYRVPTIETVESWIGDDNE